MEIKITRNFSKPLYTIGFLFVNGKLLCNTLELPNKTGRGTSGERIAPGKYSISYRYSPSQKRNCLWLNRDPEFNKRYILIHAGNSVKDTKGCILVGKNDRVGWLSNSKSTLEVLEKLVIPALENNEPVTLTITS